MYLIVTRYPYYDHKVNVSFITSMITFLLLPSIFMFIFFIIEYNLTLIMAAT